MPELTFSQGVEARREVERTVVGLVTGELSGSGNNTELSASPTVLRTNKKRRLSVYFVNHRQKKATR